MEEEPKVEAPVETPEKPKPTRTKMVNVYNSHKFRKFFLKNGSIGPGQTGRIPLPIWEKVKDTCTWLKRAERGDVI